MKCSFDLPTHHTKSVEKKSKFQVWLIGTSKGGGRYTAFAKDSSTEEWSCHAGSQV